MCMSTGVGRQRAQPRPADLVQDDQPELAEHQPGTVRCYTPLGSASCCSIWTGVSLTRQQLYARPE